MKIKPSSWKQTVLRFHSMYVYTCFGLDCKLFNKVLFIKFIIALGVALAVFKSISTDFLHITLKNDIKLIIWSNFHAWSCWHQNFVHFNTFAYINLFTLQLTHRIGWCHSLPSWKTSEPMLFGYLFKKRLMNYINGTKISLTCLCHYSNDRYSAYEFSQIS